VGSTARTALACIAVVAAMSALVRVHPLGDAVQDDGYIYFRIATNAAAGHGPVFNPGERVDAATSPVWVWLLAIATWAGVPVHHAAAGLGLLAAYATIVLCGLWSIELAGLGDASGRVGVAALGAALVGGLALALDGRFWVYAFSGMETLLCTAAWLGATRALVRRWIQNQPASAAAAWALVAALVRPEFVLIVAGIAAVAVLGRMATARQVIRTLVPAVLGGGAYLVVHELYFGSVVPNTWIAKRAWDWKHAWIGMHYVWGFLRADPWVGLWIVPLWLRSLRPIATSVGVGLLLYTLHVISLGGDHFEFHRAFLHVLPIVATLVGAAAGTMVVAPGVWRRGLVAAAAVLILVHAAVPRVRPGAYEWVRLAARLGDVLGRSYPPDTRLGLFAIGATGYASGLPVVDALGIADAHVAGCDLSKEHVCALDIGHERGDPDYVLRHADVVVFFAAYSPVPFESLEEVREGFYSHKKFLAAAKRAIEARRFVLRNIEFMPGAYWAVLERRQ
jgi:arabinofuranosyltransferase